MSLRKGQTGAFAARIQAEFGIDPPSGPKRVAAGDFALIGTGPGQWLAVWEGGGDPNGYIHHLAAKLVGTASVSDQSDGRAVLRLSGPKVRETLAKGVPVDLHPRAFGPGDSALTTVALIGAQLWQRDDGPTYEIAVARSLAGSFIDWLAESAAEYGFAVTS